MAGTMATYTDSPARKTRGLAGKDPKKMPLKWTGQLGSQMASAPSPGQHEALAQQGSLQSVKSQPVAAEIKEPKS